MIAWDLGDPGGEMAPTATTIAPGLPTRPGTFHPMKGPMTTQTLRGMQGLDPLHWRGDRTNFLHFNGAFDSLLGGSLLSVADMQAYRAYINTIVFQPNPNQNLDRTMPIKFGNGNPAAGLVTFTTQTYQPLLTCNTCHSLPTGSGLAIVDAEALQESQHFKIPHLRNVYQKANFNHSPGAVSITGYGFVHDDIDDTLFNFLTRPVFGPTIPRLLVSTRQLVDGTSSARSKTKPPAFVDHETSRFGLARAIASSGGGVSPSRTPSRFRSMPMRGPVPGGTPMTVSVSPAETFASSCARVMTAMLVLSGK